MKSKRTATLSRSVEKIRYGLEHDRVLGMLLGLHAGDSLGASLEFEPRNTSLSHKSITGGGAFDWRPGQATDDTDLALLVLGAMKDGNRLDIDLLRESLIDYLDSGPPDIGATTAAAIGRMKSGLEYGGTENEEEQGNGSLMRVAPLALLDLPSQELQTIIEKQARLTHAHPNCIFADQCFVMALKNALGGMTLVELRETLRDSLLKNSFFKTHIANSHLDKWNELPNSGWVVHSIHVLVWSLYNCSSFEDALIKVVNLGGDADTNGAICGAMWGAIEGLDSIPKEWLALLERRKEFSELIRSSFIA